MPRLSSDPERRQQRVSATIPISLLLERDESETMHDAWTVDISPTGARVRTAYVLLPGEMVGIIPIGDTGQAIPSRVVWVNRSSVGSLAGLEYLKAAQA